MAAEVSMKVKNISPLQKNRYQTLSQHGHMKKIAQIDNILARVNSILDTKSQQPNTKNINTPSSTMVSRTLRQKKNQSVVSDQIVKQTIKRSAQNSRFSKTREELNWYSQHNNKTRFSKPSTGNYISQKDIKTSNLSMGNGGHSRHRKEAKEQC